MCIATVLYMYQHIMSSPAVVSNTNNSLFLITVVTHIVVLYPTIFAKHACHIPTHILFNRRWFMRMLTYNMFLQFLFHVYTIRYLVYGRLS